MKILLAGVYFHSSFGWSVEQALLRQGHVVRVFDYRQPPLPAPPGFTRLWTKALMPRELLSVTRLFRPDLLFITKGETIPGEILAMARRETGCRIINWFPDPRVFSYPKVIEQLPHLDFFFSKNIPDLDRMRLLGYSSGRFLHHCADRALHIEHQMAPEPYRCEVAVVGSYYPYRDHFLCQLLDFDLKVWGPGWERSSLFQKKPAAAVLKEARSFEQAAVFRTAVTNINLHNFDDVLSLNQRAFDIAGSGACQLVDAGHNVESVYDVPGEVEIFGSKDELRRKIRMFLDHPEAARDMGARARKKTAAGHTYDHRLEEIFGHLEI